MKKYVKVELVAKNQISGSYAAGCPAKNADCGWLGSGFGKYCKSCERAK